MVHTFSFLNSGALLVGGTGYDQATRWGRFMFDKKRAEEECVLRAYMQLSELIALRDFLNRQFPPAGE